MQKECNNCGKIIAERDALKYGGYLCGTKIWDHREFLGPIMWFCSSKCELIFLQKIYRGGYERRKQGLSRCESCGQDVYPNGLIGRNFDRCYLCGGPIRKNVRMDKIERRYL